MKNIESIDVSNNAKPNEKKEKKDIRPIWIYIVITYILPIIIIILGHKITGTLSSATAQLYNVLTFLVLGLIMFIIFAIMYFKRIKADIKRLTKNNIIFVVIIAIFGLSVNYVVGLFNLPSNNQNIAENLINSYAIPMGIYTALIAPCIEELVFRVGIGNIIKNNVVFVIISALSFGLVHSRGASILIYVFLGAIFTITYIKTDRNLVAAAFVHMVNNAVGVLLVLLSLQ